MSTETEPKSARGGLNGLSQHREFLLDFIDPEYGLLDKLLSCGSLTKREIDRIKAKPTFQDKNEELLEHVARKHKFTELFSCLRDSRQEHIVKYLDENGDYKAEFDGCWPLMEDEIKVLDINHECLVDLIETGDLVPRMFAKKILNVRQKDFIVAKVTNHERNEALLDILRRRSRKDFWETINCLRETNQSHIAEILETKAAVACLHANLDDSVADIGRAEEEIASRIAALLKDKSSDESKHIMDNILGLVDAKLVGANVGHSVVLYFLCSKIRELSQLRAVWTDGTLAHLTGQLFNRLLSTKPKFSVTVKWIEEEYRDTKKYLEGLEEHIQSISSHQSHILDLPLELQDMILERVCLHYLNSSHCDHKETFVFVAQIVFCWFERLKKQRFITRLFRRLSVYTRALRKRALIFRNNDEFLSEVIQPKNFLKRLRTSDCLTDLQFQCINRRRIRHSNASDDILHAVRSSNERGFSAFVQSLRHTQQEIPGDVLENGGVTVKATLRSERVTNQSLLEQQVVESLQAIRQRRTPITRTTESILKRLKSQGTELVNVSHDRAIVMWIRCRSRDTFTNLIRAEETGKFVEDISELLRSLISPGEQRFSGVEPRTVVFDCRSFDKDFVTCSTSIKFTGNLKLIAEYFYGITTLDNRIYVLCQSPNSLNVFRDEKPFDLIEVFPLEDVRKPEDIGSSTKDSCLYVTDSGKKCLWKKSEADLTMWLLDIDWPFTVSVLRDGRVLLPRKGQPSHVELYSRQGVMVQRIQLPTDIIDPLHGVQTRRGSLVVSHWWRDSVTEGVFEMNGEGQLVRHFLAFGSDQHLTYPRYLALDDGDRIFVTDFDYNRVIQLDADLGWIRTLLSKEDNAMEYPERLCYNPSRRQLLVGHSGGVDVFTLHSD